MTKQPPKLEWQVCEDDAEWRATRSAVQFVEPQLPVRRTGVAPHQWRLRMAALLALLLPVLVEGYREIRRAGQTMDRVENEVRAAVIADAWTHPSAGFTVRRTATPAHPGPMVNDTGGVEVRNIEIRGDYAMVEVWTYASELPWLPAPYRQTRFYQESTQGWLSTAPPDAFYQPLATLQAGRFTFVYGPRDADAVLGVAREVEQLDMELRTELGLPVTDEALRVEMLVSLSTFDPIELAYLLNGATLYAPSPALLRLPAHISESDALLQLVAGLLVQDALDEMLADIPAYHWPSLIEGLRHWLLWQRSELPSIERYRAKHAFQVLPANGLPSLSRLGPNRTTYIRHPNVMNPASRLPTDDIATSLVEYAFSAYGRERLPVLIDGMGRYDTWEALIPAVFGVNAAEFETGWHAYLLKAKG